MATITSGSAGNWNSTGTWVGSAATSAEVYVAVSYLIEDPLFTR